MTQLIGVDFTSAPRGSKPITVAHGRLCGNTLVLESIEAIPDWPAFEALLRRPGPWLGAFDFPFGLPRAAVVALGWPDTDWAALVRHVAGLDKAAFRAALDADRKRRPLGARYPHRITDGPAHSHSPMKLVNPPVGLMFFEGAPRLLAADVHLPGLHAGDAARVALEAYPGHLARRITRASYKSDAPATQTDAPRAARKDIVIALTSGKFTDGITVYFDARQAEEMIDEPRGDRLDALLALVQAAASARRGTPCYGLPGTIDPIEGWIATVRANLTPETVSKREARKMADRIRN